MALSMNARIALLLAGVLLLSAALVGGATVRSVRTSMGDAAEASAENVLGLAVQSIADEHDNLVTHREYTLELRRDEIRNVSAAVTDALDGLHRLQTDGALSEEEAQEAALRYLRELRYASNDYFYTYDPRMIAISHPDPTVMGRDMLDIVDAKGKQVGQELRDTALIRGEGFVSYWWKRLDSDEPSPKLGYVFHYPNWDWIIGTGVYIDDVEREADRKLVEIKDQLARSFGEVVIAESGFVFAIDGGTSEVVIAPRGRDLAALSGTVAGREVLAAIVDGAAASAADSGADNTEASASAGAAAGDASLILQRELALAGLEPSVWSFRARWYEPLDWYVVSAEPRSEIDAPGRDLLTRQAMIGAGVLALSLLLASAMVRRVTGPLARLTSFTEALPGQGFRMPDETVAAVDDIARHRDEVGRLATTFLAMERALERYVAELRETTASRARIRSELRVARDIQMGILPKAFPPFPDRPEIDVHASIEPAREMGGDLYDYFFVDRDTLCIAIGDVSGKGVPAALFMAVTSTLVRTVAQRSSDPAAILAKVNDELSAENETCMFVTLFVGLLDLRTGQMRYASAGHNPPLIFLADDLPAYLPVAGEPVAGPLGGMQYTTQVLTLGAGDALLLYTDGVTEAMDERGAVMGTGRLLRRAADAPVGSARELADWVMDEVASFTGGARQSDDIAVLAVRHTAEVGAKAKAWATPTAKDAPTAAGGDRPMAAAPVSLRLPARLENLRLFRAHASASFARWAVPEDLAMRVELALEEVMVNAMTHANPDQRGIVELSCALDRSGSGSVLCLTVRDWGPAFDPTAAEAPHLAHSVAERPLGGVGLVLVRSLTDDVRYRRLDDGNALTFCVGLGGE